MLSEYSCRLPDAKPNFVNSKCAKRHIKTRVDGLPLTSFSQHKTCHAFNANLVNKPKTTV